MAEEGTIQAVIELMQTQHNEMKHLLDGNVNLLDRRMRILERGQQRLEANQTALKKHVNHNQTALQEHVGTVENIVLGRVAKGEVLKNFIADAVKNRWVMTALSVIAVAVLPTVVSDWASFVSHWDVIARALEHHA